MCKYKNKDGQKKKEKENGSLGLVCFSMPALVEEGPNTQHSSPPTYVLPW